MGSPVEGNASTLVGARCDDEKMEDTVERRRGWTDTSLGAPDGIFSQAANLAELGESVKWHVETQMMKIDFGKGQNKGGKALRGRQSADSVLKECSRGLF
ncbi:hypothetical protein ACP70R_011828 [Stipagrostis hirtigluma subsp. patula]